MIKTILLIVFGAIFFLGGIDGIVSDPNTIENIEVVQGELITVQPSEDKELGVKTDAPVLFRHVEMMQYRSETTKDYADSPIEAMINIKDGEDKNSIKNINKRERFANPPFPSWGGKTYFTGTVTVGKDGPKVSPELLNKLVYGGHYSGFKNGTYRQPLTNLPDPLDLRLNNEGSYYATNDDEKKVGHIKITYYVGRPQGVYTVAGTLENGVIGVGTDPCYIYDEPRTKKEIVDAYADNEERMGIMAYFSVVIGGIMLYYGGRRIMNRGGE